MKALCCVTSYITFSPLRFCLMSQSVNAPNGLFITQSGFVTNPSYECMRKFILKVWWVSRRSQCSVCC